jgi:hypothetical protein
MKAPSLHSVIDQLLDVIDLRPELAADVMHFIFDDAQEIRDGLADVYVPEAAPAHHPGGSVGFSMVGELRASERLMHFARAVSDGVVPAMQLGGG